jgi:hypothetical protein
MSDELIPSFEPQKLNKVERVRQRQPRISQSTQDRIAIAQEAFRWGEYFGPEVALTICDKLLNPKRKTDAPEHRANFIETIAPFIIRLYTLKLQHELILTILKLIALLIAGLLYVRRLYLRVLTCSPTHLINSRTRYFRQVNA